MNPRAWALVLCVAIVSGCASKAPVVVKKPVIKTIAVLQVAEPAKMKIENRGAITALVPLAGFAYESDSKHKTQIFSATMATQNLALGGALTTVLADELVCSDQARTVESERR